MSAADAVVEAHAEYRQAQEALAAAEAQVRVAWYARWEAQGRLARAVKAAKVEVGS